MHNSQALVPTLVAKSKHQALINIVFVAAGVLLLSVLAQVKIALPWTPVPITGQTFGVAVMALSWGRLRGVIVMISYLAVGAMGWPVFATATTGLTFGPTIGYLLGMMLAAYWMGYLADLGWTKTFLRTWLAAFSGSVITFICGSLVLSQFVGWSHVFALGVLPFLPGDFIKSVTASLLATTLRRKF